ncbi:MAG: DoxX family protein [Rhodococcus sp.]|nr:DoxX family protein [Rhodococcus sp. (in: high G+C Gram-positive bacteria)]
MLASIFIVGGIDALRKPTAKVAAAQPGLDRMLDAVPASVADRLPSAPENMVRINGAIQVGAGTLLALGKAPRIAALTLATSVVPTTITGHDFWNVDDPTQRAQQRTQFLKNIGLLGGLLLAAVDTEGKPSLGWRGRQAAEHAQQSLVAALPHVGSDHGDNQRAEVRHLVDAATRQAPELAERARERGTELLDAARERAPELAESARERSTELLALAKTRAPEYTDAARAHGSSWWDTARERGSEWAHRAEEKAAERAFDLTEKARDLTDRAHDLGEKAREDAGQALARRRPDTR